MEGESPDDFYEVTAAQKSAIEASDAAWVRPPQSFIDKWNAAAGSFGRYNEQTGFFELNGITDIGYEEALKIFGASAYIMSSTSVPAIFSEELNVRTLFPRFIADSYKRMNICNLYGGNPKIEVIRCAYKNNWVQYGEGGYAFTNCHSLRKILDTFTFTHDGNGVAFSQCTSLESVNFVLNTAYLRIQNSPKINYDSVSFWVNHKIYNGTTTIKVHPDVFAKLTGDTSNAAAAALSQEELALWMQLPDDAAAKNINFATT